MPSKHTAYLTYLRLLLLPLSQIQLVCLVYCMLISHLHKKQAHVCKASSHRPFHAKTWAEKITIQKTKKHKPSKA